MVITYVPDPQKADGKPVTFSSGNNGNVYVRVTDPVGPGLADTIWINSTTGKMWYGLGALWIQLL